MSSDIGLALLKAHAERHFRLSQLSELLDCLCWRIKGGPKVPNFLLLAVETSMHSLSKLDGFHGTGCTSGKSHSV